MMTKGEFSIDFIVSPMVPGVAQSQSKSMDRVAPSRSDREYSRSTFVGSRPSQRA